MNQINIILKSKLNNTFSIQKNRFFVACVFSRNNFIGVFKIKSIRLSVALKNDSCLAQFMIRAYNADSYLAPFSY